jgi:hypothetical protein
MLLFRFCLATLFHNTRVAALCCLTGIFLTLSAAFAHEGHEDDDATRSALASSTYPRVTAHSELYELAGIMRGERLSIYLDHFATNEPVADAKVKVAIADAEPVDAELAEKGVYTTSFPRSVQSGSVEIVFSVTAASGDDLLVGALTLPSDTGSSAAASSVANPTSDCADPDHVRSGRSVRPPSSQRSFRPCHSNGRCRGRHSRHPRCGCGEW